MAFAVLPIEDPQELRDMNDRLVREADVVIAVSDELRRQAKALNRNTHRAPNATDPAVLGVASREGPIAPELTRIPHPIVGYVGQVADKMDYQLIDELAKARPNWSFVFVGPVWLHRQREADTLSDRPNVHFLGPRPFEELPTYLRGFDVCFLPHRRSKLTLSMDPIKLYDYLATGKPVVSTGVAGLDRFEDVVWVADDAPGFLRALEQALGEEGSLRARRLAYARANSWPIRGAQIWKLVKSEMTAKGAV
jgi:glycosyltransferase involved in cell wall biosynthesis